LLLNETKTQVLKCMSVLLTYIYEEMNDTEAQ